MENRLLVGKLQALHRYPVKSMGGESLAEAMVDWEGIEGDRKYSFVRSSVKTDFPWFTARQYSGMLAYQTVYSKEDSKSSVTVRTPDGETMLVDDERLLNTLTEKGGEPLHLIKLSIGTHDCDRLSLISTKTVASIADRVGTAVNYLRFRPNLYVDFTHPDFTNEGDAIGKMLVFGNRDNSPTIRVKRWDQRCVMLNIDPETQANNPAILKDVAQNLDKCAGVYADVENPGVFVQGDDVYVIMN